MAGLISMAINGDYGFPFHHILTSVFCQLFYWPQPLWMDKMNSQSCLNLYHIVAMDDKHFLKYVSFGGFLFWCHCWKLQSIFNRTVCFLNLCVFSSLYILVINTLSSTHLAKIHSHTQTFSFTWLFLSCPEALLFHFSHSLGLILIPEQMHPYS